MLSPKEQWTLSRMMDRETGARLVPRPVQRQRDLRAAPPRVHNRLLRGRGLYEKGRTGEVWSQGDRHAFWCNSTKREKTGEGDVYHGFIVLDGAKIIEAGCDCPDDYEFRGKKFCKHMQWAKLTVLAGEALERPTMTLTISKNYTTGELVLEGVQTLGRSKAPKSSLRDVLLAAREAGYDVEGPPDVQDGLVYQVLA